MPGGLKRQKQLKLFESKDLGETEHGGDLNRGKRKQARPTSPDAAIHIVLKSSRARGQLSLLHRRNRSKIESLLFTHAKRNGIKIYRHANVGSHIHLLVKASLPDSLGNFLRAISGLIARHVLQAKKGFPSKTKFWHRIPYTRLIHWGKEFNALCAYLAKNTLEACGFGGARLRFTAKGEAVVVIGAPDFRPGDPVQGIRMLDMLPSGP